MTLCKLALSLKAGVKIYPICCARPAVACHISLTSCYLSIEREYTFWNPEFEFEKKMVSGTYGLDSVLPNVDL